MDREILFRGKTPDGKWVYGYFLKKKEKTGIMTFDNESKFYPVKSETIGQFTGITDKNGNNIFEGDILKVKTRWKRSNGYKEETDGGFGGVPRKGETFWTVEYKVYNCEMGYFIFGIDRRFHKLLTQSMLWNVDAEVCGNVYDNPFY